MTNCNSKPPPEIPNRKCGLLKKAEALKEPKMPQEKEVTFKFLGKVRNFEFILDENDTVKIQIEGENFIASPAEIILALERFRVFKSKKETPNAKT